jgi:hypothetical protein
MPVTITGAGTATGVTSVPNLQSFPAGPRLANVNMPVGSVLQVVNATTSTETTSSSATYADTTLTATITPTSATSKILVIVDQTGCGKNTTNITIGYKLLRGSTTICSFEPQGGYTDTANHLRFGGTGCNFLDSPATTSATTYKTQFANNSASGIAYSQVASATSTITLMEIAA